MQETCEVAYLFVPMVCHTGASYLKFGFSSLKEAIKQRLVIIFVLNRSFG